MAHTEILCAGKYCPKCNARLFWGGGGSLIIGSPLVYCKKCDRIYQTFMRVEWYEYPSKWTMIGFPIILPATVLLVGLLAGEAATAVFAAFIMLLVGLCISAKDSIRMLRSKKRMRNAEYLERLLQYEAISREEYERFMRKAK